MEPTPSDELLDLVSELNPLLRVVAVVTMIEAELVRIALLGVYVHPFRPWQLLPDLHQHLSFWSIERGVAMESSWERAPSNSTVRASLPTSSGGSSDTLMFEGSSRMWPSFTQPFFSCGLAGVACLPLLRCLLVLQLEGFLYSDISFDPSQQISEVLGILLFLRK